MFALSAELLVCVWLAASFALSVREAHFIRGWDKFPEIVVVWMLTIPLFAWLLCVATFDVLRQTMDRVLR